MRTLFNISIKILFLSIILLLVGCAVSSPPEVYLTKESIRIRDSKRYPPTDPDKVQIYKQAPSIPYEWIGTVFVVTSDSIKGTDLDYVNKKFREKASSIGGDAVIGIDEEVTSHEYLISGTTHTSFTYTLSGDVIRYKRTDEPKGDK